MHSCARSRIASTTSGAAAARNAKCECNARGRHFTACAPCLWIIYAAPHGSCANWMQACPCTSMWRSNCSRFKPAFAKRGGVPSSCSSIRDCSIGIGASCMPPTPPPRNSGAWRARPAPAASPSPTQANLGDGFFDTARFLKASGHLCVGSDSQSTVSPAEELRWLEYQQRLRKKRRGVLAGSAEPHVGTRLWRDAAQHGAHAIGQPAGAIAVGRRADWVVLDAGHPSMAGAVADTALDHLLFAGGHAAIRDVMVAGHWALTNGRHALE